MLKSGWLLAITSVLLNGCVVVINGSNMGDDAVIDSYQSQQTFALTDLDKMVISNGYGAVEIEGVVGLKQLEIDATIAIYAEDQRNKPYIQYHSEGSVGYLDSQAKSMVSNTHAPSVSIKVRMPAHLPLVVEDDAGDLLIRRIDNNVDIDDGSGHIVVEQIAGVLTIKDESGNITISDVANNVTLDDGSGSITALRVKGRVKINDQSGDIELRYVSDSVTIDDGSGDIFIAHVDNDVKVVDASGDMRIEHVKGLVTIEDGSGDMHIEHVTGLVTIEDGSGDIRVNYAQALNLLSTGTGDVRVDNIANQKNQ